MPINIMLVDDHTVTLEGLAKLLGRDEMINIVSRKKSADEALEAIWNLEEEVDVVLMDLKMKSEEDEFPSGLVAAEKIIKEINRGTYKPIKVIIFSTYAEGKYIKYAFDNDVHGFLDKNCSTPEIIEAIKTVSDNQMYYRGEIWQSLSRYKLNSHAGIGQLDIKNLRLTATQAIILQMVADGLTDKEIAVERKCTTHAVQAHKSNIRGKLYALTTPHMISIAYTIGLLKIE